MPAGVPLFLRRNAAGAPLPEGARSRFERSLGADLGDVRVHTGAESARSAETLGARAYAYGNDIHFAGGFDPASAQGEPVLAHEVVHTVQQRGARGDTSATPEITAPHDPAEREAEAALPAMAQGAPARVSARGPAIARHPPNESSVPAPSSSTETEPQATSGSGVILLTDLLLPRNALAPLPPLGTRGYRPPPLGLLSPLTPPRASGPRTPSLHLDPRLLLPPRLGEAQPAPATTSGGGATPTEPAEPVEDPSATLQAGIGGNVSLLSPVSSDVGPLAFIQLGFPRLYLSRDRRYDPTGVSTSPMNWLGEPTPQIGLGIDAVGDAHFLSQLMFNIFKAHFSDALGPGYDADIGLQAGGAVDMSARNPTSIVMQGGPFYQQTLPAGRAGGRPLSMIFTVNANLGVDMLTGRATVILGFTWGAQLPPWGYPPPR